jgi:hypothetical protein
MTKWQALGYLDGDFARHLSTDWLGPANDDRDS